MAANRVTVGPSGDGRWTVTGSSQTFPTQAAAVEEARRLLLASGGGELAIKGEDGRVRAQDTIGRQDPGGSKG